MIRELLNDKAVAGRRRLFFLYRERRIYMIQRRLICNTAATSERHNTAAAAE